ncbi:hypothetical protein [Sporanaerobacter acetigenes]
MTKYKNLFLTLFLSFAVFLNLNIINPLSEAKPDPERVENIIYYNQQ